MVELTEGCSIETKTTTMQATANEMFGNRHTYMIPLNQSLNKTRLTANENIEIGGRVVMEAVGNHFVLSTILSLIVAQMMVVAVFFAIYLNHKLIFD